ncbi:Hypothetical protein, putative [Bodo saltans]|uniref:Uncharacterized protein n=1 Tax=Bodo saltans TaxID=75058 RepID=A0A0S4IPN5_BODSA|nr:Hypothetical protein, putative [Bodo saltans]|eukprot:CUE97976.1 Hypothetical protein, putative [Bodo saltans]
MSFHDVSKDAIKFKQPSEVLTLHLENAQLAHRQCVAKATKENRDAVETCSLTWGEVHIRYQAWASYREPFEDSKAQAAYSKYWTRKRAQEYEKKKDLL